MSHYVPLPGRTQCSAILREDLEIARHNRVPGAPVGRADTDGSRSTYAIAWARLLPHCDAEAPASTRRRLPTPCWPDDHRDGRPGKLIGPRHRAGEAPGPKFHFTLRQETPLTLTRLTSQSRATPATSDVREGDGTRATIEGEVARSRGRGDQGGQPGGVGPPSVRRAEAWPADLPSAGWRRVTLGKSMS